MLEKFFLRSPWWTLISLLLVFSSCKDKSDKPTLQPPVKVVVMEVSPSDFKDSGSFSGTVSASESTTVSFAVPGTITALYVKEGDKVNKGQLLGKLRDGEYLNAYNISLAELAEAQDGYRRLEKLHDANALPDVKWVEMEQRLKQAQNAVEMAKRTLDDAQLHAPVSGTVTQKFADAGQNVVPVQPVFEIVSLQDLRIDIPVSADIISDFKIGQKATVDIPASGLPPFEGKVTQKSVVADPLTRNFNVKISIPSQSDKIFPGMLGNVTFEDIQTSDSISREVELPSRAVLLNDDNRWFVWVVNDSLTQRRFVEAGRLTSQGVIINSGLQSGDLVVIDGMQKVGSGTKVLPILK